MAFPINPLWLSGNWRAGWALDLHSLRSTLLPSGRWDTEYTPIGEALYLLKYRGDRSQVEPIAETATAFLSTLIVRPSLSAIIPVPPSDTARRVQPVMELAERLGGLAGISVLSDSLVKMRATPPLKNVEDQASRRNLLSGAFQADSRVIAGKNVLLFDDLYRSGETLSEATRILYQEGKAWRVYVLTITKTRTLR